MSPAAEAPEVIAAAGRGAPPEQGALPVVVVVGRPNVGKSTLFNRIVGKRTAVVEERPGVTRDRIERPTDWAGSRFVVVDTGGWLSGSEGLDKKVARQAEKAMEAADIVLVVVDGTVGVTTEDDQIASKVLRCTRRPLLVVNKVDNDRREGDAWEFLSLGLGEPRTVSALHGRNVGELLDEVVALLPQSSPTATGLVADANTHEVAEGAGEGVAATTPRAPTRDAAHDDASSEPRVAIVGRPNVGKSTLFNRLISDERSIVHDMPGTTRDSVDTVVQSPDGPIRFVDTAGIRHRARSESGTEYFAMLRALRSLEEANVVLLLVDATEGVTHQDQRLAERTFATGSPTVLVLNKWEMLDAEHRRQVLADVGDRLFFLGESPVIKASALSGKGVGRILPALREALGAYKIRIPTAELNRAVRSIQSAHPAPGARIRYAVQGATEPPTFTLFATRRLPATYLRFVERRLREEFDIGPTPMKIRVRLRS